MIDIEIIYSMISSHDYRDRKLGVGIINTHSKFFSILEIHNILYIIHYDDFIELDWSIRREWTCITNDTGVAMTDDIKKYRTKVLELQMSGVYDKIR